MKSLCLISSNQCEIDQFVLELNSIKYIISNIEGYISPTYESVSMVFTNVDECIIGETTSFSDEYISKILHLGYMYNIKINNYHITTSEVDFNLKKIKKPVVYITSMLPDMGKSRIGIELTQALTQKKLKPCLILANPMWGMLDYITFPLEIIKKDNPIHTLNAFFDSIMKQDNYDILIICVPGGIISSPKYNMCCDFGLLNYIIVNAIPPDYILNCIHQNTTNPQAIPEPFLPQKINKHLRTNVILDQNQYDFFVKNRNIVISNLMAEKSLTNNIFDSSIYTIIAEEICNIINKKMENKKL